METICFEGADYTGKTTLVRRVVERMAEAGKRIEVARQPGGTPVGERLRNLLFSHLSELDAATQYLLFTASRTAMADWLNKTPDSYDYLLLDRYVMSGYVYQPLRPSLYENAKLQVTINTLFKLPAPTHTFLLTCSDEHIRERAKVRTVGDFVNWDRVEAAIANNHAYLGLAAFFDELHPNTTLHVLDSGKYNEDELENQVAEILGL